MKRVFTILLVIVVSLVLFSCSVETTSSGSLHSPSNFIGEWYCSKNGGMIWKITSNNAVLCTVDSTLDLSATGLVKKEDSSLGWKWLIYLNDSMYEELRIMSGNLVWISSAGTSYTFTKQ